jgi:hypothetical protein
MGRLKTGRVIQALVEHHRPRPPLGHTGEAPASLEPKSEALDDGEI